MDDDTFFGLVTLRDSNLNGSLVVVSSSAEQPPSKHALLANRACVRVRGRKHQRERWDFQRDPTVSTKLLGPSTLIHQSFIQSKMFLPEKTLFIENSEAFKNGLRNGSEKAQEETDLKLITRFIKSSKGKKRVPNSPKGFKNASNNLKCSKNGS